MNAVIKKKIENSKKQFINGINDNDMMTEPIRELTLIKMTNKISSEEELCWVRMAEVQKAQKAVLDVTIESKTFDAIKT